MDGDGGFAGWGGGELERGAGAGDAAVAEVAGLGGSEGADDGESGRGEEGEESVGGGCHVRKGFLLCFWVYICVCVWGYV